MKLTTLEELEDKVIGSVGTPERNEYEAKLAAELHAYKIGEAIKKAREQQHREQLI